MSRLLYGNFDFEHELISSAYNRSFRLNRLNAELTTHLLAFADDGDRLFYPSKAPTDFLSEASLAGFAAVRADVSDGRMDPGLSFVPWGWSKQACRFAVNRGLSWDAPLIEAVTAANSRQFSHVTEQRSLSAIPGAAEVDSLESLRISIRQATDSWKYQTTDLRWILKAEFGMSGRERISGCSTEISDSQANWIQRRLKAGERLYFEPQVVSLFELSTQWQIIDSGSSQGQLSVPELIGTTQLLTDAAGQFLGSVLIGESTSGVCSFADPEFQLSRELLERIHTAARDVAGEVQRLGYFGPLGIDSMVYRGPDGEPAVRPVQDVNARLTMGRIALAWFRRFADTARPAWLLVPTEWLQAEGEVASPSNAARRLTSPQVVAGQAVRRVGVLLNDPVDWQQLLATYLRP